MVSISKIISRFKFEFASNIIKVISSGILVIFLSRILEPEGYGMLYLALSVLGFVEILSRLGIAKSTARYISKNKERNPSLVPEIIKSGVGINAVVLIIVCVMFLFVHPYIASWLDEPGIEQLLFIGTIYIVFQTIFLFVRRILQSLERIQASATLGAVEHGLRLVFAVALVLLGFEALGALAGFILALSVGSLLGGVYIYQIISKIKAEEDPSGGYVVKIGKYAVPLTASSTANSLDKQIDTILIGFFLGATPVSFYVIGKQVVQFVETPVEALGFTLAPTLEVEKSGGNIREAANLYQLALSNILLLYIPATIGVILVADPLITIIFGMGYQDAVPVLQILALYILIQSTTKITSNALDYLGKAKVRAGAKIITAIVHVLLSVTLIPTIGVEGAAISAVVTYAIYAIVCLGVMHLELTINFAPVFRYILISMLSSGGMAILVYMLLPYVTGVLPLIGVVITGATVWGMLILSTGIIKLREVYTLIK